MYRCLSLDITEARVPGGSSSTEDMSNDVPVQEFKPATVESCLHQFFRPEERDIKCEKCEDGIHATQTLRILSRPKALLLHLKRFAVVESRRSLATNGSPVELTFRKNKVRCKDSVQSARVGLYQMNFLLNRLHFHAQLSLFLVLVVIPSFCCSSTGACPTFGTSVARSISCLGGHETRRRRRQ